MLEAWHAKGMGSSLVRSLVVVCMLVVARSAHAEADGVVIGVVNKVVKGVDVPAVTVQVEKAVRAVTLELTSAAGQAVRQRAGALPVGKQHRITLPATLGTTAYRGQISVRFADGSDAVMPLDFEVLVVEPLVISVPYERLALEHEKLELTLSRAADRCEWEVTSDAGDTTKGEARFAGEPAGTWLPLAWVSPNRGIVLKIRLFCHDVDGFYSGLDLFPWKLEIPHEDVVFATGRADLEAGETPKLQHALGEIRTALANYGHLVSIKLYVSGHTDSVGDEISNRALSLARAKAIATWFQRAGVRVPVFYVGYGEGMQRVPTGDEVDEQRNRRARYVLAVEAPEAVAWQKR